MWLARDDRPCRNPPYAKPNRPYMRLFKHPLTFLTLLRDLELGLGRCLHVAPGDAELGLEMLHTETFEQG